MQDQMQKGWFFFPLSNVQSMCPRTAAKSEPEEAVHGEAVICVSAHYSVSMHILTLVYSKLCYHGSPHMESYVLVGSL